MNRSWDRTERGVDPEKVAEAYHAFEQGETMEPLTAAAVSNQTIQESMRLLLLLRAYQVGHMSLMRLSAPRDNATPRKCHIHEAATHS